MKKIKEGYPICPITVLIIIDNNDCSGCLRKFSNFDVSAATIEICVSMKTQRKTFEENNAHSAMLSRKAKSKPQEQLKITFGAFIRWFVQQNADY